MISTHSDSLIQLISQGAVFGCKSHSVRLREEVRECANVIER